MSNLIERADRFAENAHASMLQVRRYTNEPYVGHPRAVASLVMSVPHTREMIAASLLHDTIEDTAVTIEQIRRVFGDEVATLVNELTQPPGAGAGNRASRQAAELVRLAGISAQAKTIKVADIVDNSRAIAKHDPSFARVYLPEKLAQLGVLEGADPRLLVLGFQTVEEGLISLAA